MSAAGEGAATERVLALIGGPSTQARALAASMAIAVNTASPLSRGSRVWGGDRGYGVHRFTQSVEPPTGDPSARAIAPVTVPVDVRKGAQGGPSSPPAYPSTGQVAAGSTSAIAALDLGKLGNLGWGGGA